MPMTKFVLPNDIRFVLNKIDERGHEAYVVGGCVRDLLMGRVPHDWDIATSALPEQIQLIFDEFSQVLDGLKHGTVTIILNHEPVEITTFRIDGDYSDGRRPDAISFTSDLEKDLARRDFTINACAYSSGRLIDPFGGSQDLKLKTIRCVGDPASRFAEDSLRILRGLRFASELSFSIEKQTKEAMLKCIPLLENVSQERITAELCKTLVGDNVLSVLSEYRSILLFLIPELKSLLTSIRINAYSATDYLTVSIKAVSHAKKVLAVRIALLLRGLGQDAQLILHRMRLPSELIKQTLTILRYIDVPFEHAPSAVKRVLRDTGVDTFRLLLNARSAVSEAVSSPITGKTPGDIEIYESESNMINASNIYDPEDIARLEDILSGIVSKNECYNLNGLDISGTDLIIAGVPQGKRIGELLDMLLDMVIDGKVENSKNDLLQVVQCFMASIQK